MADQSTKLKTKREYRSERSPMIFSQNINKDANYNKREP